MPKQLCTVPFNQIELTLDGNVHLCCPPWLSNRSIGNIYEESIEQIWNSDVAKEIRRSILDGSNTFCNPIRCAGFSPLLENTLSFIQDKNTNLQEEMPLLSS